ncbi:Para-hydroxybenzoate--polyprenyltransferase, mitochondrial precursor (PHB:polyprenyltransferase) [Saxophila tyrrhenica]|uniref:4-hydroxybenzoate polyprenyltransferase, mitochondrial n=1 Tax=Saxophila tyrrhenica TaxID=1690608 RepID=A0AAV9NVW2_9PEZI|nr:Para-hydroxybenzoate--polyprenyltransferase, mitochondrial precursor (PHB:polyprenyltransferase) [Saxophila tyrrhenica]
MASLPLCVFPTRGLQSSFAKTSRQLQCIRTQRLSMPGGGNIKRQAKQPPWRMPSTLSQTRHHATQLRKDPPVANEITRPSLAEARSRAQAAYQPPTTGLISYLPSRILPYAELIRLDKPTGTYYLYFPCLFSTLLAAPLTNPVTSPLTVLTTSALFFAGALVMRGAGCTVNDLWDRNLDPYVARTRLRPIARGAITVEQAVPFLGFQLLTGLAILLQFPTQCLFYGIPSLILVATYPLAKRVTNYPQFVLGLTFSWGAIMGFPALGIDLLSNTSSLISAACLYGSCIAWTVVYDMIYAYQDIQDDVAAGIKSIALAQEKNAKAFLSAVACVQVAALGAAGFAVGAGPVFYLGACGGAAATVGWMVAKVNLKSVPDCWRWFKKGIGAATSHNLASKGCSLVLNYTSDSSAQLTCDLATTLSRTHGVKCITVQADMGTETGPAHIITTTRNNFAHPKSGKLQLDIIVNNAGVAGKTAIEDCTAEEFARLYNVNVRGPLFLVKATLPYLPTDRSGRIVNLSSVSASLGFHEDGMYGGTKAALEAMTRTWARELSERCTVNAVNPGPVATDMYAAAPKEFQAGMAGWTRNTPLAAIRKGVDREDLVENAELAGGRPAYDADVAGVVAMLCTPDSAWCTGSVICANGGMKFSV